MPYRLAKTAPDALLMLPRDVLDKVDKAGLTEIRLLLHVAARLSARPWTQEELISDLEGAFRRDDVKAALAFWRGVGILENEEEAEPRRAKAALPEEEAAPEAARRLMPDPDEPPFYSGVDLEKAAKSHPDFKNLVDFAEKRLNKVLNVGETAKLWSFLDYMKMPYAVLLLIIEDCCARGHGNLRYISKAVISFQDQGLDTYEKANAYFLKQTQREKFARKIRNLFGLGDRALTKTEEAHLDEWMAWGFSDEMLDFAYEKTVGAAAKPSINYMHKILLNWHESGVKTLHQAQQATLSKKNAPGERGDKSYDLDAAFEAAVARQRKDLQ